MKKVLVLLSIAFVTQGSLLASEQSVYKNLSNMHFRYSRIEQECADVHSRWFKGEIKKICDRFDNHLENGKIDGNEFEKFDIKDLKREVSSPEWQEAQVKKIADFRSETYNVCISEIHTMFPDMPEDVRKDHCQIMALNAYSFYANNFYVFESAIRDSVK